MRGQLSSNISTNKFNAAVAAMGPEKFNPQGKQTLENWLRSAKIAFRFSQLEEASWGSALVMCLDGNSRSAIYAQFAQQNPQVDFSWDAVCEVLTQFLWWWPDPRATSFNSWSGSRCTVCNDPAESRKRSVRNGDRAADYHHIYGQGRYTVSLCKVSSNIATSSLSSQRTCQIASSQLSDVADLRFASCQKAYALLLLLATEGNSPILESCLRVHASASRPFSIRRMAPALTSRLQPQLAPALSGPARPSAQTPREAKTPSALANSHAVTSPAGWAPACQLCLASQRPPFLALVRAGKCANCEEKGASC